MKYKCVLCNKEFKQKGHYDYHINRKYKCRSSYDTNNLITQNSSIFTPNSSVFPPNSSVFPPNSSVFPPNSSKNKTNLSDLPLDVNNDINNSLFCCQFCNKSFSRKDNLVRHENDRCKEKKDKYIIKELIKQNEEIKLQNQEMKQQINNLSEVINDMAKVSKGKKTSSINNQMLTNSNNLTNNSTNNLTNSNNQTLTNNLTNSNNLTNTQTNNFIFNFGEEDIKKIPDKNKLDALKCLSNSIYKFIELVNLNEDYPENQTVLFNNIRSDIGHIVKNKQLIAKNQNAIIEDLINFRVEEMEELADIYKEENKLTKTEYNDLKELITFLQTSYLETEDVDGNVIKGDKDTTKKLKKIHKTIKELLYNNRLMVGQNIKKVITK
jgi:hypothetical protein